MEENKEYSGKDCMDRGEPIEFLCDFPGPRCLKCHAKKAEGTPLERPDFLRGIVKEVIRARRRKPESGTKPAAFSRWD